MDIKLYSEQSFRIKTGANLFVDVDAGINQLALRLSFLERQTYFEVRQKDGLIGCFMFETKGHKKDHDFGWWDDTEVVFAHNKVIQKEKKLKKEKI